jgi:hypothetical protein
MGKVVRSTRDLATDAAQGDGAPLRVPVRMTRMKFNPNRCMGLL